MRCEAQSRVVRAAHTVVSPETLAQDVLAGRILGGAIADCRFVRLGLNDTYLVTTREARFVVRVYRRGWRTPNQIRYELELLAHLAAKGVPVASPVVENGESLRCVVAPEGRRYVAVFRYVAGEPFVWRNERDSAIAGQLLGALHAAADDFVSSQWQAGFDLEALIDTPLGWLRPFLTGRHSEYMEEFSSRLREYATPVVSGLDWGPIHGDFGANNLHDDPDGGLSVFDFDFCGPGWRAYDLVTTSWRAQERRSVELWRAFIDGYLRHRHLDQRDLDAVELMKILRHFWGLGLQALATSHCGIDTVNAEYLEYRLARFRRWEVDVLDAAA
jgi:Ser/Thr protein kinase RdoA (MazF antagonist)